jgi:uncharacterized protein YecE (DUF72 family)
MPGQNQLDLFGAAAPEEPARAPRKSAARSAAPVGPAEHSPELAALAQALPAGLRIGTSSWAYPGWAGLVYDAPHPQPRLSREGLAAYARHPLLRAVGVDRSYYAPLKPEEFAAYAEVVPADFRFLVKAHEACTIAVYPRHARYGALRGQPNERFLDPVYASEQVVGPTLAGLGERAGPLLFQFSPSDVDALGGPRWFAERLQRFLSELPRGPLYAVELRNRELLTGAYSDALASCGVCHCINVYPGMPAPRVQFERTRQDLAPAVVCRWMLHPYMNWEQAERAYAPFDKLVDPDEDRRRELAAMVLRAESLGLPTHLIVNNNAEGCSPRTIYELARRIIEARAAASA